MWSRGRSVVLTLPFVVSAGLCLVTLASCDDAGTDPGEQIGAPAVVVLSPSNDTLNWLTATRQFTAVVLDEAGVALSVPVTWSTSADTVATVSSAGLVTALGVGTTTITARADSVTASTSVVVRQIPAVITKLEGDGQTGEAGAELPVQLVVEVRDAGNQLVPDSPITWGPNDEGAQIRAMIRTDANGRGYATWRLGSPVGSQTASVGNLWVSAVTFTATATPPAIKAGAAQALGGR